jgi:hypothetical protein
MSSFVAHDTFLVAEPHFDTRIYACKAMLATRNEIVLGVAWFEKSTCVGLRRMKKKSESYSIRSRLGAAAALSTSQRGQQHHRIAVAHMRVESVQKTNVFVVEKNVDVRLDLTLSIE